MVIELSDRSNLGDSTEVFSESAKAHSAKVHSAEVSLESAKVHSAMPFGFDHVDSAKVNLFGLGHSRMTWSSYSDSAMTLEC